MVVMISLYFFLAVIAKCLVAASQSKVLVSIYYESLCPDSKRFIRKQFYPTWKQLNRYMIVQFIPYGKASQVYRDGSWSFSCQHGPEECAANKVQACFLAWNRDEREQVEFVNCVMSAKDPTKAGKRCAKQLSLNYDKTEECASCDETDDLLAANGGRTHCLNPPLAFVPRVEFNGVYYDDDQDQAQYNFKAVLCKKIRGKKPEECKHPQLGGLFHDAELQDTSAGVSIHR